MTPARGGGTPGPAWFLRGQPRMSTSIPPRRRASKPVEPGRSQARSLTRFDPAAGSAVLGRPATAARVLAEGRQARGVPRVSPQPRGYTAGQPDRTAKANSNGLVSMSANSTSQTAGQADRTQKEHGTQRTQRTQKPQSTQSTQSTQTPGSTGTQRREAVFTSVSSGLSVSSPASVSSRLPYSEVKALVRELRSSAPTKPHPRLDRDVFRLARRLKAVPQFTGATAEQLERWVRLARSATACSPSSTTARIASEATTAVSSKSRTARTWRSTTRRSPDGRACGRGFVPSDEIPAGDETDRLHRWGYCTAAIPCPAEMAASIHINGTGSSVIDTIFVCQSSPAEKGEVPSADWCRSALARDAALLESGGVSVTKGDLRCIGYGLLTQWAIADLRPKWNPTAEMACKLELVAAWARGHEGTLAPIGDDRTRTNPLANGAARKGSRRGDAVPGGEDAHLPV